MNRKALINAVKYIILDNAKPSRIWVYGSEALGGAEVNSDIDIAFIDESKPDLGLLKTKIEQLPTLIKVDVVNLNGCEDRFIGRVKATGKVIYSASKPLRAEDAVFNFGRALTRLNESFEIQSELTEKGLADIYLDVSVKRFEFTFEMSWKAITRVLAMLGLEAKNPRACFKEAFQQKLIKDEALWLDMIEMRNLSSHTYDESEMYHLVGKLEAYINAFSQLYNELQKELDKA